MNSINIWPTQLPTCILARTLVKFIFVCLPAVAIAQATPAKDMGSHQSGQLSSTPHHPQQCLPALNTTLRVESTIQVQSPQCQTLSISPDNQPDIALIRTCFMPTAPPLNGITASIKLQCQPGNYRCICQMHHSAAVAAASISYIMALGQCEVAHIIDQDVSPCLKTSQGSITVCCV